MQSSSTLPCNRADPDPRRGPVPGHLRPVLRPRRAPLRHPHLPLPLGTQEPVHRPPAPRPRPAPRRPAAHRPDPVAARHMRVAYLYRADLALPRRQATPAQLAALAKALAARRTCATCGTEKPYCMPRSTGQCNDCADGGSR